MNQHVRFITLGCKVNQYETQAMRESLLGAGIAEPERFGGQALSTEVDFVVINTCTVTQKADRENLYWIRRARREHPAAKIVVTGCMVEHGRRQLSGLAEVDLVLANEEKADIAGHLSAGCGSPELQDAVRRERRRTYASLVISKTDGQGRAFVKIQDGCNHACSFCKVVLVRGRARSRPAGEVLDEVKRLRDSGYREIVFAGIQLGAYGSDLGLQGGLVQVLEASAGVQGIERLRLSSIEPTDVTPALIDALAGLPKCCPHLHIPLQSGDDEILQGMNRRYHRAFYLDLVERLKARLPDFSLTLDVMTGFPGEEERHFQNTAEFLDQVQPLKCHVFPYSAREGTRAFHWPSEVRIAKERTRVLMRRSDVWGKKIREKYLGRTLRVLAEKATGRGRLLEGLTPNYLKVCFQGDATGVGKSFPVQLLHLEEDTFLGRVVPESPHGERGI